MDSIADIEDTVRKISISTGNFAISIFIAAFIFLFLGYGWRMVHETKIADYRRSNAEQQIANIEESFAESYEKKREFVLFGTYRVYPVKGFKERFHYQLAAAGADAQVREGEQ